MIYQGNAWNYIEETPKILQGIMDKEKKVLKEARCLLDGREISEMFLVGSGSSFNAAVAVSAFAKKCLGIRVFPVYPADFFGDIGFIPENAVVLGISQQGTSTAVIRALDAVQKTMQDKEIRTISMTGEYRTEITRHGEANIYIECGYEDAGATTKGFSAAVLTLWLFILSTAERMKKISRSEARRYRERIHAVIQNMQPVMESSRPWCERTADKLKDSRDMMIISSSDLKSVLLEGTLKFSETCRFPVRGFEAEEFMHGMYNAVTQKTDFLYIFPACGYARERMKKLFGYYQKQGVCPYAINFPDCGDGRKEGAQGEIHILPCHFLNDPDFSVLEYILPQQMLFVLTSRARGINLNIPKDPEFHRCMGSKEE